MKRAVFLDRDGVINRKAPEGSYVTRWEDFEILPGVAAAITRLNEAGYFVCIVTNQRCVARGLILQEGLEALHTRLIHELAKAAARIDAVYYCPHDYPARCDCRKPEPGMLLQAAREHDLDLHRSWMIGDSDHDIEAGKAAGCRAIWITGNQDETAVLADALAENLPAATDQLIELEKIPFFRQSAANGTSFSPASEA